MLGKPISLMLLVSILGGCAHSPCRTLGNLFGCACVTKPSVVQDPNIELPIFDSSQPVDTEVDGFALRAIRVAADDLIPPEPDPQTPCWARQTANRYRTFRKGDIIFVRVDYKPQNCGETTYAMDAGATYAISLEGRILRRHIDGSGPF